MTEEEKLNQMAAYKAHQRRLRAIVTDICNAAMDLENDWLSFDKEIAAGGKYEAAIPAHHETIEKVPKTITAINGLRQALSTAVSISKQMHDADPTIFPGLRV